MAELVAEVDLQKEVLISKLANCFQEGSNRPRKLEILKKLPDNLIEELRAHLQAVQKEENFYAPLKGKQPEILGENRVIRGKLFELLVEAENSQFKTPIAEEIVALMHDPGRFGLEDCLGMHRNPDLAFVEITRAGDIIIQAVGEAKLGRLDRVLEQLGKGGFRQGLTKMAEALNRIGNVTKLGLEKLGKIRGEIRISPSFKQILILPADRDSEELGRFLDLIGDKNQVRIQKSSFSTQEVAALANVLLAKI